MSTGMILSSVSTEGKRIALPLVPDFDIGKTWQ
jgi:hypothetical protein